MGAARSGHWSEGAPRRLSKAADRKGTAHAAAACQKQAVTPVSSSDSAFFQGCNCEEGIVNVPAVVNDVR